MAGGISNIEAIETIESCIQMLSNETSKHTHRFQSASESMPGDWESTIQREAINVIYINKGRQALSDVISSSIKPSLRPDINHYQISSLFLYECWQYLKSDPRRAERLHLVTGTITSDQVIVLNKMEKVLLESQSPVYVQANKIDSHKKIVNISENFGHLLLGMFHCHTAKGPGSTAPSGTDIQNLKRKEKIGVDCLGGIFSIDGFIRFYSLKEFEVEIYGKGIKQIKSTPKEAVFQIVQGAP